MILLEVGTTEELVVTTATRRAFATFLDNKRLFEWLRGRKDQQVEHRFFKRTIIIEEVKLSALGAPTAD